MIKVQYTCCLHSITPSSVQHASGLHDHIIYCHPDCECVSHVSEFMCCLLLQKFIDTYMYKLYLKNSRELHFMSFCTSAGGNEAPCSFMSKGEERNMVVQVAKKRKLDCAEMERVMNAKSSHAWAVKEVIEASIGGTLVQAACVVRVEIVVLLCMGAC